MISFLLCLEILIGGYFVYGKIAKQSKKLIIPETSFLIFCKLAPFCQLPKSSLALC